MSEFKEYKNIQHKEIRPYIAGEDLTGISISGSVNPEEDLGYIARDPNNQDDQWYITKKFFEDNFIEVAEVTENIPDEETEGEEPDLAGYNESLKETQKEQEPESIHELPNSDNEAGVETAWALVDSATTHQDKTYAMSAGRGLLVKVIRGDSVSVTFVEEARMVKDENGQVIIK